MGTDDHNLVRLVRSGDLHLDIRTGHSCDLVFLAVDLATRLGKRDLKIVSRSGEASVQPEVSLSDLTGKFFDVLPQGVSKHSLLLAKGRHWATVTLSRHSNHGEYHGAPGLGIAGKRVQCQAEKETRGASSRS